MFCHEIVSNIFNSGPLFILDPHVTLALLLRLQGF
jgi:hypothetical protein